MILLLWLMVAGAFIQVALRFLYTHLHLRWANVLIGQLDWSEPFVRLLVLWLTFLGASLVTGENKHIKIDLASTLFPPRWLPIRELLLTSASIFINAIMLKVSLDYLKMERSFGGNMFLNIPGWIGEIILPVGFGIILFRFFIRALDQGLQLPGGRSR